MTTPNVLPTTKYLRACFRYDHESGKLFWRVRPVQHFVDNRAHKTWNSRFAGHETFIAVRKSPRGGSQHLYGTLDYQHYFAHRVIWKIVTGKEPPNILDHRDQDGRNNKFANLRAATKGQNNINAAKTTRGVWFDTNRGKWAASVHLDRKQIHVGRFNTKKAALLARKTKAVELFGEFVP